MDERLPALSSDEQNVRITIPKQRLKDFIGDVLKSRRRIGKGFNSVFNAQKSDILNIISVIDHRVKEQNSSELAEISIFVLFDDGSSRDYNSIDQFDSIDDNLKAVSTVVLITATYLVKFSSDEFPTKNDIKILIKSSDHKVGIDYDEFNISISIDTNRFTWAEDIINNFSSYIDGHFKKHGRFHEIIEKTHRYLRTSILYFIFILALFFVTFMGYIEAVANQNAITLNEIANKLAGTDISAINRKLDFLISSRTSPLTLWNFEIAFRYILFLLTAALLLYALPNTYIKLNGKSYVSIGRVSVKKNMEKIKRETAIINGVFLGSILSVASSIFSSYIYDVIKSAF